MRSIMFTLVVALAFIAASAAADVVNLPLSAVGSSGVAASTTTIYGAVGGPTPHTNIEINMKMAGPPPDGKTYQGWVIDPKSNATVSLGAFDRNVLNARYVSVGALSNSDMSAILAVSLEPSRGGAYTPTTIVARGNWSDASNVSASDFTTRTILPYDECFQRGLAKQRYGLSDDQVTSLRMMGWDYNNIYLIANVATNLKKCPRDIMAVAQMFSDGMTLDQIASANNMTVASLLSIGPTTAVAGSMQQICPTPCPPQNPCSTCNPQDVPKYYRMFPNGLPVVTQQSWSQFRARGYTWTDVAVAANIAEQTGESVESLIRMVRIQGRLWSDIICERGLSQCKMMDVSGWPFDKNSNQLSRQEERQIQSKQGKWPCGPGPCNPCQPPCPAPCPTCPQ
jgi:hypothetical protein